MNEQQPDRNKPGQQKSALKDTQKRIDQTMTYHSNQWNQLLKVQGYLLGFDYQNSYSEEQGYDMIAGMALSFGFASLILASTGMRHFPSGKPLMTGFLTTIGLIDKLADNHNDFHDRAALFLRSYKKVISNTMEDANTINETAQAIFDHMTMEAEYEKRKKDRQAKPDKPKE